MSQGKKYSQELIDLIVNYYKQGKSPYWMVNNVEELKGKRPSVIYGILNRQGYHGKPLTDEQRLGRRKYHVNDNIFEVIDTEEKAYWLGFILADGYVTTTEDKVGISLSIKDKGHLEKFKTFIGTNAPINVYKGSGFSCTNNEYCRLLITSRKMKQDLIRHGVHENKTFTVEFPSVREDLIPHLIRGYFDGDGVGLIVAIEESISLKFVELKSL